MIKQFYERHKNSKIDFDGRYGYQCVDLFRQFIKECISDMQPAPVPGACQFYKNYEKDTVLKELFFKYLFMAPDLQPNDIIIFPRNSKNPFGHVAVVYAINGYDIQVVEQDGFTQTGVQLKTYKINTCLQVLRPKRLRQNKTHTASKAILAVIFAVLCVFAPVFASCSATFQPSVKTEVSEVNLTHGQIAENLKTANKTAADLSKSLEKTDVLIDQIEKEIKTVGKQSPNDHNPNDTADKNKTLKNLVSSLKEQAVKMNNHIDSLQYQLETAEFNLKLAQAALSEYESSTNRQINKLTAEQYKLINDNKRLKKALKTTIFIFIIAIALTIGIAYFTHTPLKTLAKIKIN